MDLTPLQQRLPAPLGEARGAGSPDGTSSDASPTSASEDNVTASSPTASSAAEPGQTEQAAGTDELDDDDIMLANLPDNTQATGVVKNKLADAEGFYDMRMIPSGDIKKFKRSDILKVVRKAASV